ncbi:putative 5'-3' exonuclease, SAM domain protein [Vibrio coralliirubri]|uniref:5'-3' exonuclease H3TH domain-containing protein n=1 Tax=Vibrio coralliirubri TaxID=1516159 RepID=UPI0006321D14|nr:5'-3' exonuclease H3TH domain-containing protein [Vibrio coralliirubri]CDT53637.1 putative 5'-3' exonuclease, SAM domain protein [Vibrio coralliirubri]
MAKHAIVVDGNSLGYAAQNSRPLKTGDGQPVQAIFGMLRTIKNIRENNPRSKIIILWDSPKDWRSIEFPDYKANRESTDELKQMRKEFKVQRPQIIRALFYLGIDQLKATGFEADDLAWVLGERLIKKGFKIDFLTADQDWLQLVTEDSQWVDPINNRTVTIDTFEEFTGCRDWQDFIEVKALKGDKSDNIGGIPGIGEKTALAIVTDEGGVAELCRKYDENGEFQKGCFANATLNRARNKINAMCGDKSLIDAFNLNYRLMDLRDGPKPSKGDMNITKGHRDAAKFREFCEDRQFKTILKEISMWDSLF